MPVRRNVPVRAPTRRARRISRRLRERGRPPPRLRRLPRADQPARVNKKGRCGHLRRFLIDTFGAECVGSGAPILDVGGGRGELAFELCNLNGADAFVVDVVPMRLARYESKLERGWYDRSAPLAKYNDRERRPSYIRSAAYDACSTATPQHETPKHLRLLWSPALWRVRDDAGRAAKNTAEARTAAKTPTRTKVVRFSRSLRRHLHDLHARSMSSLLLSAI